MKKNGRLIIVTTLGLLVMLLGIVILADRAQISRNQSLGKNDLVAVVAEYQQQARYNRAAFPKLLKIAEKATYNHDTIKTAAYILAYAGFHTQPVMQIAEIAGNADHEVGHLEELLEIIIIYPSDCETIVGLAKQAANHQIIEAELLTNINYYRSHAQAKTIDEAIQNSDNALGVVDKKIAAVIQTIQRQNNHQAPSHHNSEKERFIAAIQKYIDNGQDNQSEKELVKIATSANYNLSVIQTAANFLSQPGHFQDWVVVNIAKLAGAADREIKLLNGLLEVSITYGGDSFTMIDLAIKAVTNEISDAELESRIAYYRSNAEAKTIDEALENSRKMFSE